MFKFHCTCCSTKIEAFRRIIGWWAFRFSDMIVFSHYAVTKYSDNRKWMYLSVLFHIMSGMIYWYLFVYIITYVLILYKIMIFAKIWWLFMLGYNDWHCTMMFRIQCSIALLYNGHWYSCDMEHFLINTWNIIILSLFKTHKATFCIRLLIMKMKLPR